METSRTKDAISQLHKARDALLEDTEELMQSLKRVWTACQLLGFEGRFQWVEAELNGYYKDSYKDSELPDYRVAWVNFQDYYTRVVEVPDETHRVAIRDAVQLLFTSSKEGIHYAIDSELAKRLSKSNPYHRIESFYLIPASIVRIINGVSNRLLELTTAFLIELEYSNVSYSIFEEVRLQVDKKLTEVAKGAATKLTAIHERLGSNQEEDWTQISLECRRMMKDVADSLFPPQGTPYKDKSDIERDVGENNYVNRLLAYVDVHSGGSGRKIIMAETQYLGSLLDQLVETASEGVHAKVSKTDAHRIVIYTYLSLGDILML